MQPVGKVTVMSYLDSARFDRLSEAEVLQRIGGLLAKALTRSGQLRPSPSSQDVTPRAKIPPVDFATFVANPQERQIVAYISCAGSASPAQLRAVLGLSRRCVTRRLACLRAAGLCEVVGKTRAAHYHLRQDFSRN